MDYEKPTFFQKMTDKKVKELSIWIEQQQRIDKEIEHFKKLCEIAEETEKKKKTLEAYRNRLQSVKK